MIRRNQEDKIINNILGGNASTKEIKRELHCVQKLEKSQQTCFKWNNILNISTQFCSKLYSSEATQIEQTDKIITHGQVLPFLAPDVEVAIS